MVAKKKKLSRKKPKSDYLKLTAIGLLVLVVAVSLFVWWNPGEPLNMMSTIATSIAVTSFAPILFFGGLIFTILMLLDSWRNNKLIWFVFILLAPGVVALLYFLVEKPKIILRNLRPLGWFAIGLFLVVWLPQTASQLMNKISPPPDNAPFITFQGALISKDVVNGPGVYYFDNGGKSLEVHIGPASSCDDQAAAVPDLEVGQKAEVHAKQYDEYGSYASVCAEGSYVKKL